MENKEPLAVLFAVDKDDEGDCNPILIIIGNKDEVEARKVGLEAAIADFEIAVNSIYADNPYKLPSEVGLVKLQDYNEYIDEVRAKINKELTDLRKDKPPYYNHNLIMLSQ